MEFKLFESLLAEAGHDIDKDKRTYNVQDDYGSYPSKDIKFDRHNKFKHQTKVYGNDLLVINMIVDSMVWHSHKHDELFNHGVETLNVTDMTVNGKVLFSAHDSTLPVDDLRSWDGDPRNLVGMDQGIESVIQDWEHDNRQDLINLYQSLIKAKPNLWHDIVQAMVHTYEELDDADAELM